MKQRAPFMTVPMEGVWGAALIPFRDDGSAVDTKILRSEMETLSKAGVDGIYAHGSTGEPFALNDAEVRIVDDVVADVARAQGVPYQLGVGRTEPSQIVARVHELQGTDVSAIQVVLPDWSPLSMHEAESFLARIIEIADDTPIVLYNPPHAKRVLSPEELHRLVDALPVPLAGVKTGGGGAEWFRRAVSLLADTSVFVPGHTLANAYRHGAAGSFSNIVSLSPRGATEWWKRIKAGDPDAIEVEALISEFFAAEIDPLVEEGYSDAALDKYLSVIGGYTDVGTRVRWPYSTIPSDHVQAARSRLESWLPELRA